MATLAKEHAAVARSLILLLLLRVSLQAAVTTADIQDGSPPVYGAYPTGGPVAGGTSVTIFGSEFDQINRFPSEARCSWGDPREWQQAVFAAQQAEMDNWADDELALPQVPPAYFTTPYDLRPSQPVTTALREALPLLPATVTAVDMLVCDSFPRTAGDVSLWFSLQYTETVVESVLTSSGVATRIEPNLLDTGVTFMFYPVPVNFTNAFITGGPLDGGTHVVIDGSGFTKGYRNESDIDMSQLIVRCRFTDKPSIVDFREVIDFPPTVGNPPVADTSAPPVCAYVIGEDEDEDEVLLADKGVQRYTLAFDFETNGPSLSLEYGPTMLETLFVFHDSNNVELRLGEQVQSRWLSPSMLALTVRNSDAYLFANADIAARVKPEAGFMVSIRPDTALSDAVGRSQPVSTRRVPLAGCRDNATKATAIGLTPEETFVTPMILESERVVCSSPVRAAPLVTDLAIALNGQDYNTNALEYAYFTQPTTLTHLSPVGAGPTYGGSVVTIHGEGLAAFAGWGAGPESARCRWDGTQQTVPTYLDAETVVCATAPQLFGVATNVRLELALNNVDFIDAATLEYTYYVQPQFVRAFSPTGGQLRGGTLVTIDGSGFDAYPGVAAEGLRLGWGDTFATNLTTPEELSARRMLAPSYEAVDPGDRQIYLAMNAQDLFPINATFLYYKQPDHFASCLPTGGPTGGGTTVTIVGGPFQLFSKDPADLLCRFGVNYTRALSLEDDEIVCLTPPAEVAATVDVAISLNGAETDFASIGHAFKYYVQPRTCAAGQDYAGGCLSRATSYVAEADEVPSDFLAISPVGGPRGGATLVTITGEGFMAFANEIGFVRCRWDGGIIDPLVYASLQLPPYNLAADAPPPETAALEFSATRIVCPVPPARPGMGAVLNVSLSLNAGVTPLPDFGDTGMTFTLYATPVYESITPSGGHREGGTTVTIMGSGFDVLEGGAHVSCQFGHPEDNAAYNPKYTISRPTLVEASKIVCVSPSTKVSDSRQIWVALNGYDVMGCADPVNCGRNPTGTNLNFTYYVPPTVFSVLPQAGVFSGDTVVTLLGQGFHGLAGNKAFASCRFVSSNSISDSPPIELDTDLWTCRSPAQNGIAEGEATQVYVTLNAQQYVNTGYKFSYFNLRIDEVSVNGGPPGGITSGGTIVTLRGAGFDRGPVKYCRFGESKLQRTTVLAVNNASVMCPSPASPGGVIGDFHLLLSADDLVYIDTGLDYTYYVQPSVFTSVEPEGGPKRGGTMTTLTGEGFSRFVSESQPLTDEMRRTAARCLWGGEFSSALTVNGLLRNSVRSSIFASGGLQMSGQAGVSAPLIVSAEFADPDNRDVVLSDGDTLTIVFDSATNQAGEGALTLAGDRALVDKLFQFSHSLGTRYSGRWTDASTFVVDLVDTTGNAVPGDLGACQVSVVGDLKNANELSRWSKATSATSGDVGSTVAPSITLFDAQTWDRDDPGWSRYDTLSITFDVATDRGGREGGKAFVDTILSFSHDLGADYSGQWADDSTFIVTSVDATPTACVGLVDQPEINYFPYTTCYASWEPLAVNTTDGTVVAVVGEMRNRPGTSSVTRTAARLEAGNFGEVRAPRLLRFVGYDHDSLNASYDKEDVLMVQFDMAVNAANCTRWETSVDNYPTLR